MSTIRSEYRVVVNEMAKKDLYTVKRFMYCFIQNSWVLTTDLYQDMMVDI